MEKLFFFFCKYDVYMNSSTEQKRDLKYSQGRDFHERPTIACLPLEHSILLNSIKINEAQLNWRTAIVANQINKARAM